MASEVQAPKYVSGTNDQTVAYTSNVTDGNLMIAAVMLDRSTTETITGVSDAGGAWTLAVQIDMSPGHDDGWLGLWYKVKSGTGAVTATFATSAATATIHGWVSEVSGIDTLEDSQSEAAASGRCTTPDLTVATASDNYAVVLGATDFNIGTLSAGSGWASDGAAWSGTNWFMFGQDRFDAGSGALNCDFTESTSDVHAAVSAVWGPSGGGPSGPPAGGLALLGVGI